MSKHDFVIKTIERIAKQSTFTFEELHQIYQKKFDSGEDLFTVLDYLEMYVDM